MKIAVFDIGTNSIHMLVVEIRRDFSFEVVDHEKDTTRLGDGSFETGVLSKEKMDRALSVIDRFARIARSSGVRRIVAAATSAVREAKNGGEFVDRLLEKTGIKVQVVTGEEEGRLIFLAATSSVNTKGKNALVVDIGGGSVELVLGNKKEILFNKSFKLGVARLTDHFIRRDPPSPKELKRLRTFLRRELGPAVRRIRRLGFSKMIGTSGTVINLASMVLYDEKHSPLHFVNHFRLRQNRLEAIYQKLLETNLEERRRIPSLDPKRADLIIAGAVLLGTLMRLLKAREITLSDKAIREGIVLDFIRKNEKRIKGEEENPDIRERSVLQLARRSAFDENHSRRVAELALRIFDGTRRLHRLGKKERELLYFACLLHDIGYCVSFNKHHKHTYYLIVNNDLDGFDSEEIEMMGAVARYHRKRLPKPDDPHFRKVGLKNIRALKVLSAILRVADGLDRTHFSVVQSVDCRIRPRALTILVKARQDAELELWQANQRKELMEKVFRRKVEIRLASKG